MSKLAQPVAVWQLEGRFLSLLVKDGKPKYLRLMTADGEYCVKLAKELRASVSTTLIPGAWIQVWGEKKNGYKTDPTKLKAFKVSMAAPGQTETAPPVKAERPASATILVCQKSDCLKRGGKAVCRALEAALSDRNLTDQVTLRGTGCMKQCKAGPHVVFMPEKARYSRVAAHDVAALVDEQFPRDPQQN
jgi:(2Fe-2S) ferredoxin